jgi:tripartite-type tricarboxylate transporter receptor subunit TctC
MKITKKVVSILLIVIMVFSMVGCKSKESKNGTFPSKDLAITVPFGVGGSADTKVRLVSQYLEKEIGKNIVVTNRTGAGGAIAATEFLSKKSDPHNLLLCGIGMFTIAPLFNKDIKFSLEDFKPVSGVVSDVFILYANPNVSNFNTLDDVIQAGKKKNIIFGSNAPGGTTHLLQAALFKMAGVKAESVPGKSTFVDITNLLGGHVDVAVAPPSVGAESVKDGSIVPIAVFSQNPYTGFEGIEVPTVQSFGYDIVFESSNFLMARADIDDETIDNLYNKITSVYDNKEFIEQANKSNYIPNRDNSQTLTKKLQEAVDIMQKLYDIVYE